MKKNSKNSRLKPKYNSGDLIQIWWRDAIFIMNPDEIDMDDFKAGGVLLKSTGYLVDRNDKSVMIAAELSEDNKPHRDFNLIPIGMIEDIKLLKRGSND